MWRENVTRGKKKRYFLTQCLWVSQFWQTLGGQMDLTASLKLIVEVAEVVQGVEDELPLWGISAEEVLIPQKIQQAGH